MNYPIWGPGTLSECLREWRRRGEQGLGPAMDRTLDTDTPWSERRAWFLRPPAPLPPSWDSSAPRTDPGSWPASYLAARAESQAEQDAFWDEQDRIRAARTPEERLATAWRPFSSEDVMYTPGAAHRPATREELNATAARAVKQAQKRKAKEAERAAKAAARAAAEAAQGRMTL